MSSQAILLGLKIHVYLFPCISMHTSVYKKVNDVNSKYTLVTVNVNEQRREIIQFCTLFRCII